MGGRLRPVAVTALVVVALAVFAGCSGAADGDGGNDVDADSSRSRPESEAADVLNRPDAPVDDGEADLFAVEDTADSNLESTEPLVATAPDGYVVWAHHVQPSGLADVAPVSGGLFTSSWLREALFESLYSVDSSLEYVPELLAGDAAVAANDDGTVNIAFRLRPELTWSDGEPLTSADVEFTHRILIEGCLTEADGSIIDASNEACVYPLADRNGYDLVTSFEVTGELTFEISMAAFYADWRGLYSQVLPTHALGEDASEVVSALNRLSGPDVPASGPLMVESWDGATLRLARNDSYHGSTHPEVSNDGAAAVAGVQVSFVPTIDDARQAVASGAADLMVAPVSGETLDLLDGGDVAAVVGTALEYDHLAINSLNRHLADPLVRSAVVAAIGRREAVEAGYDLLLQSPGIQAGRSTIDPDGVGNAYWLPSQAGYQDNQAGAVEAEPEEAARLLTEAGYQRDGNGPFSHPERGSLSLRFSTNAGDTVRTRVQEVLSEQLTAVGFDITADNGSGGSFLTDGPFSELAIAASLSGGSRGDPDLWDLALFAWAGGPWPGVQSGSFRSDSEANPYGFEDPEFDAEAARCDTVVDDDERGACYQGLDLYVTTTDVSDDGLVVVPLVERPTILLYSPSRLTSVPAFRDGVSGGPLADVVDYMPVDAAATDSGVEGSDADGGGEDDGEADEPSSGGE